MLNHTPTSASFKPSVCTYCNASFKTKTSLEDHIIRNHPDFIAYVSSKIHDCPYCRYKTTMMTHLTGHIFRHHDAANSGRVTCNHCDSTYKTKGGLDNHIINKHPNFIASVSSKIYRCTLCTYKTTMSSSFTRHTLTHPKTANRYKIDKCDECYARFKSKEALDDHIIRRHPDLIASVSSEIHNCPYCTYKTTLRINLAIHLSKHPELPEDVRFPVTPNTCVQCYAIFKTRYSLDNHIVNKHPDCIASVSTKIHNCSFCTYKTVSKHNLATHMSKHPETAHASKVRTCIQCSASYKYKIDLDDHIVRKHPSFIQYVSSKIYECTRCDHKTTMRRSFVKHLSRH
nr:unnamed protein product [Callosobruchus chinensis]